MPTYTPKSEDSRLYECCVLYPYPLNQKEENTLLKEIDEMFADAGATLVSKDPWGRRGLAYPIGGFMEGSFVVYYYDMNPAKVKEVDNALRIQKGVLRHMFIKPPKGYVIENYARKFEQWGKDKILADENREREREEKLKQRVLEKAKRPTTAPKKEKVDQAPRSEKDLTKEIDKLISDENISL